MNLEGRKQGRESEDRYRFDKNQKKEHVVSVHVNYMSMASYLIFLRLLFSFCGPLEECYGGKEGGDREWRKW